MIKKNEENLKLKADIEILKEKIDRSKFKIL
jgi:hypothetical protein